jgi:D,D-heptose 1,7-bisphosphate phosphatase
MQLVILAGGKGTRMGSLSERLPKPMIPVAGKPILARQIELARRHGITEIMLLTGYLGEAIEDYFGDGSRFGVHLRYRREPSPLGTAGALAQVEDWIREDFLVFYGDLVMDVDLDALAAEHNAHRPLATLVVHPNNHPDDSDLLAIDAAGRITGFYPKPRQPGGDYRNLVNAALYLLSPEIFRHLPRAKAADLGRDIFPALVRAGQPVFGYQTSEYLADVGTPERLDKAAVDLASGKVARLSRRHPRPAVFLDRDGVLNVERGDLARADDLELLPGVAEAVRRINESGYLAVVVTNQPAVAKGLLSERELDRIHARLETLLGKEHAWLDRLYYCPHHPDGGYPGERPELKTVCRCRKPSPGMLRRAAHELNIDLSRSVMIGDRTVDIEAGRSAGVTTILVRTGCGGQDGKCPCQPDRIGDDLSAAVDWVLERDRRVRRVAA